jgi:hypothetical protein
MFSKTPVIKGHVVECPNISGCASMTMHKVPGDTKTTCRTGNALQPLAELVGTKGTKDFHGKGKEGERKGRRKRTQETAHKLTTQNYRVSIFHGSPKIETRGSRVCRDRVNPPISSISNMSSSIPTTEYQILVQQSFRCKGVPNYSCPLFMHTFDRAGYQIANNHALCPSCYSVFQQEEAKRARPVPQPNRIQAKQRIIHFLHTKGWTVGHGGYTLPFKGFWEEFYQWSEKERLYTKKSLVRSVLAEMCGVAHDASHIPIDPV